jgi:hypothetical protein
MRTDPRPRDINRGLSCLPSLGSEGREVQTVQRAERENECVQASNKGNLKLERDGESGAQCFLSDSHQLRYSLSLSKSLKSGRHGRDSHVEESERMTSDEMGRRR